MPDQAQPGDPALEIKTEPAPNGPGIVAAETLLPDILLILPVPTRPVFPHMLIPIILHPGREADILKAAWESPAKTLGIVLRKGDVQGPLPEIMAAEELASQLYRYGTAAHIERYNVDDNRSVHAILTGRSRFRINSFVTLQPMAARVTYHADEWDKSDREIKAYSSAVVNTLRELIKMNPLFSEEIKLNLSENNINEPGRLADFAASLTTADKDDLEEVLETGDIRERLRRVLTLLKEETEIAKLKEKINQQIEEKLSKQQREFFLREQLKAIKEELGIEKDEKTGQVDTFREKLDKLTLPDEARKVIDGELDKFSLLSPQSPEYSMQNTYLDWLVTLPWGVHTKENLDVARARRILEKEHYGLNEVKERILEFIGVSKLKGSTEGSILCFIGPPGVGKTSLGQAIAHALNRKFYRFSLGGMRDEAEIKGHRRTYIGAMPGKIIQAIKLCGSANPLIMLDEVDKVGNSFRGDPASALLEVLDPEQNQAFLDHYIDIKFDLSKVLFIATANVLDTIPPALLDRMELLNMAGYLKHEKIGIARHHLIPRQLKAHGLDNRQVTVAPGAVTAIVDHYTREAGVRRLENNFKTVFRKIAARKAEKPHTRHVTVTTANIEKYLGKRKFLGESMLKLSKPGVVIGLAWTPVGGTILFVESSAIASEKSGLTQTGQLGDVMKESVHIGYSHVQSLWPRYAPAGREKFFDKHTIHLHVPAGATPKDGPSAGITMAVSLLSLATNLPVRQKIGMTGELTLTGRVLPIGGLKEKLIAAKTAKLEAVIVPDENRPDYDELSAGIRKGLKVHFVREFTEVAAIVFGDRLKKRR
ncbi:MAG: endopeptidase La [Planctomycetota bacterium]